MPVDPALPMSADDMPLHERTELRDVRMISIDAAAPGFPPDNADIQVSIGELEYMFDEDTLLVRVKGRARYLASEPPSDAVSEADSGTDAAEILEMGRVTVGLLVELAFLGGETTQPQIDEFLDGTLKAMVFPYLRSALQEVAADLRLPTTVLPPLRYQATPVL